MNVVVELGLLALLIGLSALYSGSETGFYSVSSVQVDLDAKSGSRRAGLMRWLLRDEAALLITILIGNNLALELATHVGESFLADAFGLTDAGTTALVVTLVLTPTVFLFGEALPKDLFRQRPHALTGLAAPIVALSRIAFWPLERALRLLTAGLERLLGLSSDVVVPVAGGRDAVMGFLAEGRRHGVLSERAERLAGNALRLKVVSVETAMVAWDEAHWLQEGMSNGELFAAVRSSRFSRIPVVRWDGQAAPEAVGYIHQLEVLHLWSGDPEEVPEDIMGRLRPLPSMDRDTSVERALSEFHASGRRIAVVVGSSGSRPGMADDPSGAAGHREGQQKGQNGGESPSDGPEEVPKVLLGLLSVNDLLARISDEVVA